MWWLVLVGCVEPAEEEWSQSGPGWDIEGAVCWEEPDPVDTGDPADDCMREVQFEMTEWDGSGGTFSGTWEAGPHGQGTTTGEWYWDDWDTRVLEGTWAATDGRAGVIEARGYDGWWGPEVSGYAYGEDETIHIWGLPEVGADGTARGNLMWTFAEAYLYGRFMRDGEWLGGGFWNDETLWAEGWWEPWAEDYGSLSGTWYHDSATSPVWGEYFYDGLYGEIYLSVEFWGHYAGSLWLTEHDTVSFEALGFPGGC